MKYRNPFKLCQVSKVENEGPVEEENSYIKIDTASKIYYLDDALKATGCERYHLGKFHLILLSVSGFSLMSVALENNNIGFVLPYARCDIDMSTAEQGILGSIVYVGTIISSQFWGIMADATGRRRILLISMAGTFIFSMLTAFTFNINTLIITRLFGGIFVTGIQSSCYAYIGEFHSCETRAKACSFVTVFVQFTFILFSLLAWGIIPIQLDWEIYGIPIKSWRVYLLLSSLFSGFNFICVYLMPESPKFLLSINRKVETLKILEEMYSMNTHFDKKYYPVKDLKNENTAITLSDVDGVRGVFKLIRHQMLPLFKPPFFSNFYKICYVMFALNVIGNGLFAWFPYFLTLMQNEKNSLLCKTIKRNHEESHYMKNHITHSYFPIWDSFKIIVPNNNNQTLYSSDAQCNNEPNTSVFQVLLAMGVIYVVISILISLSIDKVNRKILFASWALICALSSIIINYVPEFYTVSIAFIVFLSTSILTSIVNATCIGEFPSEIRATTNCLIVMFGRIGAVAGGNFAGLFLVDYCYTFFTGSGILIATCIVACIFLKRSITDTNNGA